MVGPSPILGRFNSAKIIEMQKAIENLRADLATKKGLHRTGHMSCLPLSPAIMSTNIHEKVAKHV